MYTFLSQVYQGIKYSETEDNVDISAIWSGAGNYSLFWYIVVESGVTISANTDGSSVAGTAMRLPQTLHVNSILFFKNLGTIRSENGTGEFASGSGAAGDGGVALRAQWKRIYFNNLSGSLLGGAGGGGAGPNTTNGGGGGGWPGGGGLGDGSAGQTLQYGGTALGGNGGSGGDGGDGGSDYGQDGEDSPVGAGANLGGDAGPAFSGITVDQYQIDSSHEYDLETPDRQSSSYIHQYHQPYSNDCHESP